MTDLTALIARVEALSGPDREVDLEVMVLGWGGPRERYLTDELGRLAFGHQWKFTASLDAVVALAERLFPERDWNVCTRRKHPYKGVHLAEGTLWGADPLSDAKGASSGFAPTPALALLLALLRAVQAEQNTETT